MKFYLNESNSQIKKYYLIERYILNEAEPDITTPDDNSNTKIDETVITKVKKQFAEFETVFNEKIKDTEEAGTFIKNLLQVLQEFKKKYLEKYLKNGFDVVEPNKDDSKSLSNASDLLSQIPEDIKLFQTGFLKCLEDMQSYYKEHANDENFKISFNDFQKYYNELRKLCTIDLSLDKDNNTEETNRAASRVALVQHANTLVDAFINALSQTKINLLWEEIKKFKPIIEKFAAKVDEIIKNTDEYSFEYYEDFILDKVPHWIDLIDNSKSTDELISAIQEISKDLAEDIEKDIAGGLEVDYNNTTGIKDWAYEFEKAKEKDLKRSGHTVEQRKRRSWTQLTWEKYFKQEWAGIWGTENNKSNRDGRRALKYIMDPLFAEIKSFGYTAKTNPFIHYLKSIFETPANQKIVADNPDTYYAIHEAYRKNLINAKDLLGEGTIEQFNMIFCMDLYSKKHNYPEVTKYLEMQKAILKLWAAKTSGTISDDNSRANSNGIINYKYNNLTDLFRDLVYQGGSIVGSISEKNHEVNKIPQMHTGNIKDGLKSLTRIEKELQVYFGKDTTLKAVLEVKKEISDAQMINKINKLPIITAKNYSSLIKTKIIDTNLWNNASIEKLIEIILDKISVWTTSLSIVQALATTWKEFKNKYNITVTITSSEKESLLHQFAINYGLNLEKLIEEDSNNATVVRLFIETLIAELKKRIPKK